LLLDLDACVWQVEQGQPVTAQTYRRLASAVETIGPLLDDAERAPLAARVDRMLAALEAGRSRVTAQIRKAGAGRRAVKGYGNLARRTA